jgi:hypothetical protein
MITSHKFEKDTIKLLKIATSLIWLCIYDLGLTYCYIENNKFKKIEIAIKKVIKLAGLDYLTSSRECYILSTKLSPELIATKQIIQLGLKNLDIPHLLETKPNCRVPAIEHDRSRPFYFNFRNKFNNLSYTDRKFILQNYKHDDKKSILKIKSYIKNIFIKQFIPDKNMLTQKYQQNIINNNGPCFRINRQKSISHCINVKRKLISTPKNSLNKKIKIEFINRKRKISNISETTHIRLINNNKVYKKPRILILNTKLK